MTATHDLIILGGGFTGLAAALEACCLGAKPLVLEAEGDLGGLAADTGIATGRVERFYHHWFTGDTAVLDLVQELGLTDRVHWVPTRTAIWRANSLWRLSSPLDLLRFAPLPLLDRIRLGLLTLRVRNVTDWRRLEDVTAQEWLRRLGGDRAWSVVWEPLLRGKFGRHADEVSAVWMWNKLVMRGGSRSADGRERLAWFEGGFGELARLMAAKITDMGGEVRTGCPVTRIMQNRDGSGICIHTPDSVLMTRRAIATFAPPVLAGLVADAPPTWTAQLSSIRYLASICVMLELDRSLGSAYWVNVNDPGFPFVGVIEHTNLIPTGTFGGRRLAYLARYLPVDDPLWEADDRQIESVFIAGVRRMFPAFQEGWLLDSRVWRARWAQPLVDRGYGRRIPPEKTPMNGLWHTSMAHIYPEDRGTNHAVREGRRVARIALAT